MKTKRAFLGIKMGWIINLALNAINDACGPSFEKGFVFGNMMVQMHEFWIKNEFYKKGYKKKLKSIKIPRNYEKLREF